MKNETFHFGQFVWFSGESWLYQGMDEDGTIQLIRPIHKNPFQIIETNYKENGIKKGRNK